MADRRQPESQGYWGGGTHGMLGCVAISEHSCGSLSASVKETEAS